MVGGGVGGGPCCHFQRAEEGLLLPDPRGPGLKGFLRTPQARLFSSEKRSREVLMGHSVTSPIGDGELGVVLMTAPQKMTS